MLISIDWLQIHLNGIVCDSSHFRLTLQPYTTQVFRGVYAIESCCEPFGTIVCDPISPILDPKMCILKLENKVLYQPNLFERINYFIKEMSMTYKGITRLDICADFNHFHNNVNPENLIKKFMCNDYRYKGKCKYKIIGSQTDKHHFEYLRFGNADALCSAYIYNKTKELSEQKMKKWIVDSWERGGLDTSKTIWRLEFSIKGNQCKLVDKENGNMIDIDLTTLNDSNTLKSMYYALQDKYFHLKRNTGNKNVTEMPSIQLLPTYANVYERVFISSVGDGSRADKIFIKKLEGMNAEIRAFRQDIKEAQELLLHHFVEEKGLRSYYNDKINGLLSERDRQIKENEAAEREAWRKFHTLKKQKEKVYAPVKAKKNITQKIVYSQLKFVL